MTHYRKGGDELRAAYFKWRFERPTEKHSVVSFAAGYNAAKQKEKKVYVVVSAEYYSLGDIYSTLELAKTSIVNLLKSVGLQEEVTWRHVIGSKSWHTSDFVICETEIENKKKEV